MYQKVKKVILPILNKSGLGAYLQLRFFDNCYLQDIGWFNSIKKRSSVDKFNSPLPWITYPCIQFLDDRVSKDMNVFEFGSGNSSLWYAKKANKVYSVEDSKEWYESIKNQVSDNCTLFYASSENSGYENKILDCNILFDIIVVDGNRREECLTVALKAVSNTGIIILDNSERPEYNKGKDLLLNSGFKKIDFWGMSPSVVHVCCTTIFYKSNNCLNI